MKRAVNIRLDEQIICMLNQLAEELETTKTEIVERAIELFSKEKKIEQNNLLQFAGIIKPSEADAMLRAISEDKNSKDVDFKLWKNML